MILCHQCQVVVLKLNNTITHKLMAILVMIQKTKIIVLEQINGPAKIMDQNWVNTKFPAIKIAILSNINKSIK